MVRWKDQVRPRYAKLDRQTLTAAEAVIRAYTAAIGQKRIQIREQISELEDAVGDYKLVRGLAALMERQCIFKSTAHVNPVEARHRLFQKASADGYPTTPEQRKNMIETLAHELGISPLQLETSIYADLEEEEILENAPATQPAALLKTYNLSLTQTLLFNCTEMTFTSGGSWQRIFRAVKRYGLMYTVQKAGGEYAVKLDGPISILKLTRRYGTALARILPEIIAAKPWRIQAKILRGRMLLNFTLESHRHSWLFPEHAPEETYDSMAEAEFAEEFRALAAGWTLTREPQPIQAGSHVLIPDFAFQLGATRIYMEVVGFWTREYLRRKIEKLQAVKEPFIVAVDTELACDKLAKLEAANPQLRILYYRRKIPVGEVLKMLQPLAMAEVETQCRSLTLQIRKPIMTVSEVAREHGVMAEAVRQKAHKIQTHMLIGETFIEKTLLETIKNRLRKEIADEAPLDKALEILKPLNPPDPISIIIACGYKVKWQGLTNATIVKQESSL
ncbi:MAG: DUF790 family protein [Candidatus Bathyarchaeota archaeon]|nr:DUF790 family protein [Candidatus Bathyarchaeota archaeon]